MALFGDSNTIVAACRTLSCQPGVRSVGFGLRVADGEVTLEPLLRVYVDRNDFFRGLVGSIPPEVGGIRTEAVPLLDGRRYCGTTYRPGTKITRYAPGSQVGSGTLCCFLQRGGKNFLLTNYHVFFDKSGYDPAQRSQVINVPGESNFLDQPPDVPGVEDLRLQNQDTVYQPDRSECLQIACNSPIATIRSLDGNNAALKFQTNGARQFWVDAAIAEIDSGKDVANDVNGIGVVSPTIRDLSTDAILSAPPPNITVQKRGFTTDLTKGTITQFFTTQLVNGASTSIFEFVVRPTNDSPFDYDNTIDVDDAEPQTNEQIKSSLEAGSVSVTIVSAQNPRRLRVKGKIFSDRGDSGSLILDANRQPVGILWGGDGVDVRSRGKQTTEFIPNGLSRVCYLQPVLVALGFDPATAILSASSPARGSTLPPPHELWRAEELLIASTRGRELVDVVRLHSDEVRELINRGRRVTVVWRRFRGAAFVSSAIVAAREPDKTLAAQIGGISIETFLEKMYSALLSEASETLQAALQRHMNLFFTLAHDAPTFAEILERLEEPVCAKDLS